MTELHARNGHAPPLSPGRPNAYAAVLYAARAVLALAGKAEVVVAGGDGLTVTVTAPTGPAIRLPPLTGKPKKYRGIHHKLIAKATFDPTPTKELIRLAGYDPNTYSRGAVTQLCRWGDLVRLPDGLVKPKG